MAKTLNAAVLLVPAIGGLLIYLAGKVYVGDVMAFEYTKLADPPRLDPDWLIGFLAWGWISLYYVWCIGNMWRDKHC